MFGQLIATLKKSPKTIVFTEGTDPRILEASARLLSGNFLKPVLVGNPEEIAAAAEDAGFNIRGAEIADPANYPEMDAMVEQMVELRKGQDDARAVPRRAEEGQLLRHHARQDGRGRLPARRRDLLHRGHRASRAAAHQDQARQQHRLLLLHHGPSRRVR